MIFGVDLADVTSQWRYVMHIFDLIPLIWMGEHCNRPERSQPTIWVCLELALGPLRATQPCISTLTSVCCKDETVCLQ